MRKAFAAVVAAVLLVGGCSSGKSKSDTGSKSDSRSTSDTSSLSGNESGKELADKAKAALVAAKSFRISGEGSSDGEKLAMDLGFTANGSSGSITMSGTKIELTAVGDTVYFKAPDEFWKAQAGAQADQVLAIVSGKWIKVPAGDSRFGSLTNFANKQQFLDQVDSDEDKNLTKGDEKTIDGVQCVSFKSADTTVYVDRKTARPVEIDPKDGGKLTFSQYDSVPEPTAPPAAETIDASKLGG